MVYKFVNSLRHEMTPEVPPDQTPFARSPRAGTSHQPLLLRRPSTSSLMQEEEHYQEDAEIRPESELEPDLDLESGEAALPGGVQSRQRKRESCWPRMCPYTDVDRGWSWVALLATFCANTIMGAQYCSVNIFYAQFLEVFGESRAYTSWFGSLNAIVLYSSGFVGSYLMPKIGVRKLFFMSSLAVCVSFITISFSHSLLLNIAVYGLLGGLGYGFVLTGSVAVNVRYFRKYIYQATSVSFVGGGLGTLLYGPLLASLMDAYGWRGAALVYAGIALNLCVVGCAVFPERPGRQAPPATDTQDIAAAAASSSIVLPDVVTIADATTNHKTAEEMIHQLDEALHRMSDNAHHRPELLVVSQSDSEPLLRDIKNLLDEDSGYHHLALTAATAANTRPLLRTNRGDYETLDGHDSIQHRCPHSALNVPSTTSGRYRSKPDFWLLAAIAFTWGFGSITFLAIFKDLTTSSGMHHLFGTAVLLFGGGNTLTRILISFLPFGGAIWRLSVSLMLGSGVFCLFSVVAHVDWAFLTLSALAGCYLGFSFVMVPVSVGEVFGRSNMAVTYGYILFFVGLSNAVGPPLIGFLRDTSGSYATGLGAISVSTLIGSILATLLQIRQIRKKALALTLAMAPPCAICQT